MFQHKKCFINCTNVVQLIHTLKAKLDNLRWTENWLDHIILRDPDEGGTNDDGRAEATMNLHYNGQDEEMEEAEEEVAQMIELAEFVGDCVMKYFNGALFEGGVIGYDGTWWKIEYNDGDREDMTREEVLQAKQTYIDNQ